MHESGTFLYVRYHINCNVSGTQVWLCWKIPEKGMSGKITLLVKNQYLKNSTLTFPTLEFLVSGNLLHVSILKGTEAVTT